MKLRKTISLVAITFVSTAISAQETLSLASCRDLAIKNNHQLQIAKTKQDIATNMRKTAQTKYLPHVDVVGGYTLTSKEVSLLNNDQKALLQNLGSTISGNLNSNLTSLLTGLAQSGAITPQMAQQLGGLSQQVGQSLTQFGNQAGAHFVDAFRTDTRNLWTGAVVVKQPIYMGGAITAANKLGKISEELASNNIDATVQNTIYEVDKTYWLVVSLKQKQNLAKSYLHLVEKLNEDVHKMIKEGVATRANGLKVDVKVNEAEMQVLQVENGLSLAKMLLCQLCGLPVDSSITLEDENKETLSSSTLSKDISVEEAFYHRPELRMLQNNFDISVQKTRLTKSAYLPQVALTGGYLISNPSVFNGFQKKFSGVWNVGVLVKVPVWSWSEGVYKTRASEAASRVAALELKEAKEKISLQITQSRYKLNEANKRLAVALKNITNADENLRCANLGFKEGVMETTDVMAAQTAWQQAQTMKIEAEIEVKLAQVNLQKALGLLK